MYDWLVEYVPKSFLKVKSSIRSLHDGVRKKSKYGAEKEAKRNITGRRLSSFDTSGTGVQSMDYLFDPIIGYLKINSLRNKMIIFVTFAKKLKLIFFVQMKPNLMTLFLRVNLKLTDISFLFLEGIETIEGEEKLFFINQVLIVNRLKQLETKFQKLLKSFLELTISIRNGFLLLRLDYQIIQINKYF